MSRKDYDFAICTAFSKDLILAYGLADKIIVEATNFEISNSTFEQCRDKSVIIIGSIFRDEQVSHMHDYANVVSRYRYGYDQRRSNTTRYDAVKENSNEEIKHDDAHVLTIDPSEIQFISKLEGEKYLKRGPIPEVVPLGVVVGVNEETKTCTIIPVLDGWRKEAVPLSYLTCMNRDNRQRNQINKIDFTFNKNV